MSEQPVSKDYGLEDVCTSLDAVEAQLKRIVLCQKIALLRYARLASEQMEIEKI